MFAFNTVLGEHECLEAFREQVAFDFFLHIIKATRQGTSFCLENTLRIGDELLFY